MLRNYYSLSEKRKRQIDTLKIFNDNVVELKENSEYRVEFIAGDKNMSLDVILGPEFPNEKPTLLISPIIIHPWVIENKIVAAPGLLNFTIHSDLGRVVHAIIREFERNPPMVSSTATYIQSPQHSSVQQDQSNTLSQNQSPIPLIGSLQFPQLNDLSFSELQCILESVDLQDEFLKTLPESTNFDKIIDDLRNQVEQLATENLSKQKIIQDLKATITDDILTAEKLQTRIDELNKTVEEKSEPYSMKRIKELLNESATFADEDAEGIVEDFLSGSIPADVFIIRYTEKRGLGQCRRAKFERMSSLT